jgi:hypothetical protein
MLQGYIHLELAIELVSLFVVLFDYWGTSFGFPMSWMNCCL